MIILLFSYPNSSQIPLLTINKKSGFNELSTDRSKISPDKSMINVCKGIIKKNREIEHHSGLKCILIKEF